MKDIQFNVVIRWGSIEFTSDSLVNEDQASRVSEALKNKLRDPMVSVSIKKVTMERLPFQPWKPNKANE